MYFARTLTLGLLLAPLGLVRGAEPPTNLPRPLPVTRPALKQLIEDVKVRQPRIPLPEVTEAEREQLGTQADSYESRLRWHYLQGIDDGRTGGPGGRGAGAGTANTGRTSGFRGQPQDPNMTLDNAFKVELFWIVSRANNCQYCIGHQESKLLAAGLTEDRIAALDSNWTEFKPEEQLAFAFARKYSFEPHLLSDTDIDGLRKHFTDAQILEMILSMAGNNSINRWKEGVGVPQRKDEGGYSRLDRGEGTLTPEQLAASAKLPRGSYLTPTSPVYEKKISRVAPLVIDKQTGEPTQATVNQRPQLETRAQVEEQLAKCRSRKSRLPLVEEPAARAVLADKWKDPAPLPNWVRLLVHFPRTGVSRIATTVSSEEKGDLTPLLKAQLSWIVARQDRAWYVLGLTRQRLLELGQSDDQVFALDGDWKEFTPREQSLFAVARQLGASPVVLTDAEVARAVELAGPRDVVQAISYITNRAAFNRITEAAGLPLEK